MKVRHQENHGSMEDTFRGERALGKVGSVLLEGFLVGLGRRHLVCVRRSSRDPASGLRDVADPIFQPAVSVRKDFTFVRLVPCGGGGRGQPSSCPRQKPAWALPELGCGLWLFAGVLHGLPACPRPAAAAPWGGCPL